MSPRVGSVFNPAITTLGLVEFMSEYFRSKNMFNTPVMKPFGFSMLMSKGSGIGPKLILISRLGAAIVSLTKNLIICNS